ncbi:MAG: MFS transporter [Chloroflexi bacterium]|nr:MFS transporter [Chloroflexota bacterium]
MRYLHVVANVPLALRLALMNFLFNLAIETSIIFLPLYVQTLGASNFEVGFIVAVYGIAFFLSSLFFGRQSDIHGRLVFIRSGLAVSALGYFLQVVVHTPMTFLLVRGLIGFCLGVTSASVMAYAFENQKGIGNFASYGSFGWLLGSILAAVVRDYEVLFISSAIASVLAFMVSLALSEIRTSRITVSVLPVNLVKANLTVYLAFFLRQLGGHGVWTIFPLFLTDIGASKLWIAILNSINMIAQFIAMRLVERFNPASVFRAGLVMSALTFGIYGVVTNYLQLIPVQIVLAVSWACLFIGAFGYLLRWNVERGTASGLLYSTMYLSAGVGPFIGGAVSELWGFRPVMYQAFGFSLLGLLVSRGLKTREPGQVARRAASSESISGPA